MLWERRGSLVLPRFSSMVTGPGFERVERLIEMEPLDRPQEVDDIAAGGKPEAVVGAGLRVHSERRHRSEEHTSELQSLAYLVCRLLLEKKKKNRNTQHEHQCRRSS